MKAIISSTYDDKYLFFLPIVTWCWNKLGVDVICFLPYGSGASTGDRFAVVMKYIKISNLELKVHFFKSPEHKEATYAQCSRLYAAALDLPENEILLTSDVDMAVFKIPEMWFGNDGSGFSILGGDLVPDNQFPMCYISARVKSWRDAFCKNLTYQECLDSLLGEIQCENMRGNYWGKDQEEAYNRIFDFSLTGCVSNAPRARPGTQFAKHRIDRDDAYFLERLSPDIVDFHMHRPGCIDDNFEKILTVIKYFYPNENLDWMRGYQQQYKSLL